VYSRKQAISFVSRFTGMRVYATVERINFQAGEGILTWQRWYVASGY